MSEYVKQIMAGDRPVHIPTTLSSAQQYGTMAAASCDYFCERDMCQNHCQVSCENCLGNACQNVCQTCLTSVCENCQGTGCQTICQNCLGDPCQSSCQSGCQNVQGCTTTCELACQNCQGVACQTCQYCQTTCEMNCQNCQSAQIAYTPATFTYSDVTDTSAKFTITPGTGYTNIRLLVRLYDDATDLTYDSSDPTGNGPIVPLPMPSGNLTLPVTVLQPSTHYAANVHSFGGDASRGEAGPQDFWTTKAPIRVTSWNWDVSNGTATPTQTKAAYNAISNKGYITDFSYLVWNDLVSKVNETIIADGKSWIASYDTLQGTYMSSSDKDLTAKRFNSLRENIGRRSSTGISEVKQGDTVYGSYFITIAQKLNEWIARL